MYRLIPYLRYLSSSPLALLGLLVSGVATSGVFLLTALIGKTVYDRLIVSMDTWLLIRLSLSLSGLMALAVGATFLFQISKALLQEKIVRAIQLDYLKRFMGLRYGFFLEMESGRMVKIIVEDLDAISRALCGLVIVAALALQIGLGLFAFHAIRPWICWTYLNVIVSFLAWFMFWKWPIAWTASRLEPAYTGLYSLLGEYLKGLRDVKLLSAFPYIKGRWMETEDRIRGGILLNSISHASFWVAAALPWIAFPVLLSGAVHEMGTGEMTIGLFVAALTFLWGLFDPLVLSVEQLGQIQMGGLAAKRVAKMQGMVPEQTGNVRLGGIRTGIEFKDVSLKFKNGVQALENVSMFIPAGAKVGLVGSSGSGKSTLVNLLLKLHDDYRGSITIDGVDLKSLSTNELRDRFAYLPQEAWLVNDTLRKNIDPEDRVGDRELIGICEKAGLGAILRRLPGGLGAMVWEAGANFSGGERQRIALARCLARKADLVLLDEPTSSLDPQTEGLIWKALRVASEGKTMITVTHRMSLLDGFDLIMVMDSGRLVQTGSYGQLAADENGFFRKLARLQQTAEIPRALLKKASGA